MMNLPIPILAKVSWPQLMFMVGCGLLTWILLKRCYRYFGRRSKSQNSSPIESQPRPTDPWSGVQRDAFARLDREQVEMQERARDLSGQLNSKIIALEQLIATSAQQIERMEMLLAQSTQQENTEVQDQTTAEPVVTAQSMDQKLKF